MKAAAYQSIVLGAEAEPEARSWVGDYGPIGIVAIPFDGPGSFTVQSQYPEALMVVEEAFRKARWQLLTLIAEKRNSALVNAPGADALDEADRPAEGEQPPPRPAAPPSNPPDGGL